MINISNNSYKNIIILILIGIFLLFLYSYTTFIAVDFNYYGFLITYNNKLRIITGILILIIFFILFKIIPMTDIMLLINSFLYQSFLFPSIIMFMFHPNYSFNILLFNLLFVLLVLMLSTVKLNLKLISVGKSNTIYLFLIIILLFLPFFVLNRFNFNVNITNPFVYDVEDRRMAFGKLNSFLSYLLGWMIKIIIPFGLALSMYKKKYLFSLLFFGLLIYLFLVYTQRAIFFTAFLVFFFALFKDYKKSTLIFNLSLFFLYLGVILIRLLLRESHYSLSIQGESVVIRRIFFIPQLLNTYYFEFFANNHMYLSYSKLSFLTFNLIKYPYSMDPPFVLGKYYYGNPQAYLNNGFISVGYMDFGYIGIIVYMLLILLVLVYFNSICVHPVFMGIIINILFLMLSSSPFVIFLSFGLFLLMPLLYISPVKQCSTEYY